MNKSWAAVILGVFEILYQRNAEEFESQNAIGLLERGNDFFGMTLGLFFPRNAFRTISRSMAGPIQIIPIVFVVLPR
jgi:hypothetical protein